MEWSSVFVEKAVGNFCCGWAVERFRLVMDGALDVCWQLPDDHFLDQIIDREVADLLLYEGKHFGWKAAVAFDAVENDGCLLALCSSVPVFEVLHEVLPFVFSAVAKDERLDS